MGYDWVHGVSTFAPIHAEVHMKDESPAPRKKYSARFKKDQPVLGSRPAWCPRGMVWKVQDIDIVRG
jgi:hypothetical protein